MSAFDLPAALTTANWEKQKAALGKDKAVAAKLNPAKVADALKNLNKAHSAIDESVFDPRGLTTAAEAEEALDKLDAEIKGGLKDLRGGAKLAEAALDEFAAAAEKLRKTVQGPSAAVVVDVMGAASTASKAASAFDKALEMQAKTVRAELAATLAKLKTQGKKEPVANPKDAKTRKFVRAKAMECIRKIKNPSPGAKPWRFIVVKGTPTITVCMLQTVPGGSHEKMLKSMIPKEKTQTLKDAKGEVIWEKKAVTLVSDRLPTGLAKRMQEWLKKLTGLNPKVRIRKTTGEVEESEDGADIPDESLKPDPTEVAEKAQAGKNFTKRLADLAPDIKRALGAPQLSADAKAEIKGLIDSITRHGKAQEFSDADDDLDALEALLEPDDGEPAAAPGSGSAPGAAAAAEPASGGLSVKQLATARLEWGKQREHAIAEITRLAQTLVREFQHETEQQPQVVKAVKQFQALAGMLKTDLEQQLDAALGENDSAQRARLAATAKQTLKGIQSLLDHDPLMVALDGNELITDMKVVEPMKKSLGAIEAALG
ncbi:MAG TPA: hypothetical protein VF319_01480 [Caldimonas sp.]